ncbi:hypothetical protein DSY0757 [Desulfitobacterium hafniense Y51]|uniref:Uncharacterized protein n=1 Tax=Desulfitobacterium hafniense (strain Y51) TaxID=138119 RepID=Q24ZJ6_DESHY|nr:hypothetical protein DSY0757 [Desulfitobacterium hafniense Y51]
MHTIIPHLLQRMINNLKTFPNLCNAFRFQKLSIGGGEEDRLREFIPALLQRDLFIPEKSFLLRRSCRGNFRTTFLRNLFDSGDRSVAVGVPEYWHEIDNFESDIIIEFADKTILYRNGEPVEI